MAVIAVLVSFIPKIQLDDRWADYFDESLKFRTDMDYAVDNSSGSTRSKTPWKPANAVASTIPNTCPREVHPMVLRAARSPASRHADLILLPSLLLAIEWEVSLPPRVNA